MADLNELQTKVLIENLIFALSGFDTSSIYLQNNPPSLAVVDLPVEQVEPFGYLIIKIREFQNEKTFSYFVEKYLKKISSMKDRIKKVEELYISLQDDMVIFRELDRVRTSGLDELQNDSKVKMFFSSKKRREIERDIKNWVNYGEAGSIIEVRRNLGFTMCLWQSMFKLKSIGLNKDESDAIEECGKIVCFIRAVFQRETVEEEPEIVKNELFENYRSEIHEEGLGIANKSAVKRRLSDGLQELRIEDVENRENKFTKSSSSTSPILAINEVAIEGEKGVSSIQTAVNNLKGGDRSLKEYLSSKPSPDVKEAGSRRDELLRPYNYGESIAQRRYKLNSFLNSLIYNSLKCEFNTLYRILFIQDLSFYNAILTEFSTDFLNSNNNVINKINSFVSERAFSFPISCSLSNVSLTEYILKLLKTQTVPQTNAHLVVIERFYISLVPKHIHLFFSPKTFTEIKIINRFLFTINSLIYFLDRSKMHKFVRVVYLLFMRMKQDEIKNEVFSEDECEYYYQDTRFTSINDMIEVFQKQITVLLRRFYLTDAEIFSHLGELIGIATEYIQIEFKENVDVEHYNIRTRTAVDNLLGSILKNCGECEFTEYIRMLEVEKYLG